LSDFFVVGLGNPGQKYALTRHNVGFLFVDKFLKKYPPFQTTKRADYFLYSTEAEGMNFSLVKPMTFMNESGLIFRSLFIDSPLIIHDDLDLPIGRLRIRPSGSAGGHNGIKSIIANLGRDDFPRIRVGIGPKTEDAINYVLGRFSKDEYFIIDQVLDLCVEATISIAKDGLEMAMNKYNAIQVKL
jgi:PTH1 family peptidyl-tRNA hydrolase